LRMSMFLELSRPAGDVSRWEKVLKRLTLLNKHHPLKPPFNCQEIEFQRKTETVSEKASTKLYHAVRDSFIEQGVVFFGGYAASLYARYMDKSRRRFIQNIPDFDVISEDPDRCAVIVTERLEEAGFKRVTVVKHNSIDDVVPEHVQIMVGKETLAFIFKPIACYSYNTIEMGEQQINIATIDTMLSFYLAFIYADRPYFENERILCMAQFLFDVEQSNRLNQKGLLKRFTVQCYGKQPTLESIRAEKAEKFKELMHKRNSPEWNAWFFKYSPNAKLEEKGKKEVKEAEKAMKSLSQSERKSSVKSSFIDPSEKKEEEESVEVKESKTKKSYLNSFIDPRSYSSKSNQEEEEYERKNKTVKKQRKNKRGTLRRVYRKKRRGFFF
jgi:hypothetical protein